MSGRDEQSSGPGWLRAALISLFLAVASIAALVVVPNLIVTRWIALLHTARVAIATAWFFVALFAIAGVMRWLQGRHVV